VGKDQAYALGWLLLSGLCVVCGSLI